jgi:signal peptidase II
LKGQKRAYLVLLSIAAFVALADQVSKYLVREHLAVGQSWDVVPWLASVFRITYVTNTGVGFGLFQGVGKYFVVVSAFAVVAIIFYYRQIPHGQWLTRIALGLALGGAIGNLIDRALWRGTVVDFIDVEFWPFKEFPVFNVADSSITVGTALLVLFLLWEEWQERRDHQADESD